MNAPTAHQAHEDAPGGSGLERLVFDNRFIRELPADPETRNFRRQVERACYSRVSPIPVRHPVLIAYAEEVANDIGLNCNDCETETFAQIFAGNRQLPGMDPHATAYGGHQFGHWAGQLGDGRAINLGDVLSPSGDHLTLQLKGAGPTPYSRTADGLAVLRSSIREFLCSEAMHHLGVPTTRALSVVSTGETVIRDMFYDGHPIPEPGAVVCRVAPSFVRFGHFELFAARGDTETLRKLVDYTIRADFPDLGEPDVHAYIAWFEEVCQRTADLIVNWQRVGFVHGVMNTDNMSILGLTIDYGPYGWLEDYDPDWTPNTTDASGRRYRFGNQPAIAGWNLVQLAQAIFPLIEQTEALQNAIDGYSARFERGWRQMMADKLGWTQFDPQSDGKLIEELMEILRAVETDMTLFYRGLAQIEPPTPDGDIDLAAIEIAYYQPQQVKAEHLARTRRWLEHYFQRLQRDGRPDSERHARMNAVNPKFVLRNYLAQLAIEKAEQHDFSLVRELLETFRHPYDEQPDKTQFSEKRPEWARHRPGCSMLSCSS